MTWPSWSEVAEVLKAMAALLWPVVIIFAIFKFHRDVRDLISGQKLRRGKLFGQEVEFDRLDQLEKETRPLQQANEAVVSTTETAETQQYAEQVRRLLREPDASPKAALMLIQAEIERQLRDTLRSRGIVEERVPYLRAMEFFRNTGEVPADFGRWLTEFREVRNAIIHGRDTTDEIALRAIDIGARILAALDRIAKSPRITPATGQIRTGSS